MLRTLSLIVLVAVCVGSFEVSAEDLREIPPGMPPRPTPECGGEPMIALWEAERIERLEGIAGDVIGPWFHALEPRLRAVGEDIEQTLIDTTLERYERCLAAQPVRDVVCVAAASGRAELCDLHGQIEKRGECRMVVEAIRATETRDPTPCELLEPAARRDACVLRTTGHFRCTGGSATCLLHPLFTPGGCGRLGVLSRWQTPIRTLCRWVLWLEAARGEGACDAGLDGDWGEGCRAVSARAPEACPPPSPFETGLILDSVCRDEAVGRILSPQVDWAEGTATLSVVLYNPFREAARCTLNLEGRESGGPVHRVSTPVFQLPGNTRSWRGEVIPFDVRIEPVAGGLSWRVRPECSFTLRVLEGTGEAGADAAATFDE